MTASFNSRDIPGLRVTVMGLGLHGGGLSSALFFARRGAVVTVTDMRNESVLKPSLDQLVPFGVRTVLGRHEETDFTDTDLVIKNPGVQPDSRFLAAARSRGVEVETDLSVFLSLCRNPLIAVTGSKGKSTTASAIDHCLKQRFQGARLGGNITISPLEFLEDLGPEDPVVLELSSWQLADLKDKEVLKPRVALLTVLMADHQDKYPDMDSYLADKKILFQSLDPENYAVFNHRDPLQTAFARETRAKVRYFSDGTLPGNLRGAYLEAGLGWVKNRSGKGRGEKILSANLRLPGEHNRLNLLSAGLAAHLFGLPAALIRKALSEFPGIEHRLELVAEKRGIRFYNDSAATVPEATKAALESLDTPIILLAGGTDKNLDFHSLVEALRIPQAVYLLRGSATDKLIELLDEHDLDYRGPFGSLEEAFAAAVAGSAAGSSLLFSPGCASFEMFLNEFDRGRKFKRLVLNL